MLGLQRIELDGKRYVVLPEAEYERLCTVAGETIRDDDQLPPLPDADAQGRFPAVDYGRAILARNLIRDRRAANLTQQRLAELSGVRQETISRIESGKHTASARTIEKLDRVIEAERKKLIRKRSR